MRAQVGTLERMVAVTHFSDPGCPWAYSASPAHAVLRWRYREQLQWRLVVIGLTEQADQYLRRGYTPAKSARGYLRFRRRGMPFATQPRERISATGLACRAIVATRLHAPEYEHAVFRALQFGWFTTPLVFDEPGGLAEALKRRRRTRRRRDRGQARRSRRGGGLPGRPRRGADRRGQAHARPGQGRPVGRPRALHGAVADLRLRRRSCSRQAASSPSRPTTSCSPTSTRRSSARRRPRTRSRPCGRCRTRSRRTRSPPSWPATTRRPTRRPPRRR